MKSPESYPSFPEEIKKAEDVITSNQEATPDEKENISKQKEITVYDIAPYLKEVVEDQELAERMAYAVNSLRETAQKLYTEAKEKLETLGFDTAQMPQLTDIEPHNGIFQLADSFSFKEAQGYKYDPDKYDALVEARNVLRHAGAYESQAKFREDQIALATHALKRENPDSLFWKTLIVQNIVGAYIDGYVGKVKENPVGRVAGSIAEKVSDTGRNVKDEIEHLVDKIRWGI